MTDPHPLEKTTPGELRKLAAGLDAMATARQEIADDSIAVALSGSMAAALSDAHYAHAAQALTLRAHASTLLLRADLLERCPMPEVEP